MGRSATALVQHFGDKVQYTLPYRSRQRDFQ